MGMRTLLLDDEHTIVTLLERICSSEGCEVACFTSSAEAMKYMAVEPVDLLITDLNMPGPDGMSVIREAWRLQPDIFTLIVTGHAGTYPLEEILSRGTADVMFKPFHHRELRARLELANRRRSLIQDLSVRNRELQNTSTEMIHGLQEELAEARRSTMAPALLK